MADKKTVLPKWMGKPILDESHHGDLEQRSAIHEFQNKLPRAEAEGKAYDEYVKDHRQRSMAHHKEGLDAANAVGNKEDAFKHWLLFDIHAKALGLDSVGPVASEIKAHIDAEDKKHLYKFKAHKADIFALQDQEKDKGEPETKKSEIELELESVQELSKSASEGHVCQWRLGERKCKLPGSRMVGGKRFCHNHENHWATKITQREAKKEPAELEKAQFQAKPKVSGDPDPAASHGEYFEAEHGSYYLLHSGTKHYKVHYVSHKGEFKDLDEHSSRKDAMGAMHSHHDQKVGLGKSELDLEIEAVRLAKGDVSVIWRTPKGESHEDFQHQDDLVLHQPTRKSEIELELEAIKLAKGDVIRFPGNPSPAKDLGQGASVIEHPVYAVQNDAKLQINMLRKKARQKASVPAEPDFLPGFEPVPAPPALASSNTKGIPGRTSKAPLAVVPPVQKSEDQKSEKSLMKFDRETWTWVPATDEDKARQAIADKLRYPDPVEPINPYVTAVEVDGKKFFAITKHEPIGNGKEVSDDLKAYIRSRVDLPVKDD